MKKPVIRLDEAWARAVEPNRSDCLANECGQAGTAESVAMMRDFAEDLQSLLESIASLCNALHTPELDHWTMQQRKVIDTLDKAIREAATAVDQVCVEFAAPNPGHSRHPRSGNKLTH